MGKVVDISRLSIKLGCYDDRKLSDEVGQSTLRHNPFTSILVMCYVGAFSSVMFLRRNIINYMYNFGNLRSHAFACRKL